MLLMSFVPLSLLLVLLGFWNWFLSAVRSVFNITIRWICCIFIAFFFLFGFICFHLKVIKVETKQKTYNYSFRWSFHPGLNRHLLSKILRILLDESIHIFPVFSPKLFTLLLICLFIHLTHFPPNCASFLCSCLMIQIYRYYWLPTVYLDTAISVYPCLC